MSDNKYKEVATKKMVKVLSDDSMDVVTKAKAIGFCIEKGADVNVIDRINNSHSIVETTALNYASVNGYKEIVELLLENGADVKAKDDKGWTALMYASIHDNKEIVEILEKEIKKRENKSKKGVDMFKIIDKER